MASEIDVNCMHRGFMLLLAELLRRAPSWRLCKINVFAISAGEEDQGVLTGFRYSFRLSIGLP